MWAFRAVSRASTFVTSVFCPPVLLISSHQCLPCISPFFLIVLSPLSSALIYITSWIKRKLALEIRLSEHLPYVQASEFRSSLMAWGMHETWAHHEYHSWLYGLFYLPPSCPVGVTWPCAIFLGVIQLLTFMSCLCQGEEWEAVRAPGLGFDTDMSVCRRMGNDTHTDVSACKDGKWHTHTQEGAFRCDIFRKSQSPAGSSCPALDTVPLPTATPFPRTKGENLSVLPLFISYQTTHALGSNDSFENPFLKLIYLFFI